MLRHQASMGPRFCKRGNVENQATVQAQVLASMGPRFCKRGNQHEEDLEDLGEAALQWGHAFVSVETGDCPATAIHAFRASMGPRFCKRGNPPSTAEQPNY